MPKQIQYQVVNRETDAVLIATSHRDLYLKTGINRTSLYRLLNDTPWKKDHKWFVTRI